MTAEEIREIQLKQRAFFRAGKTRDLEFRLEQLGRFREALLSHEQAMYEALQADLRKPSFEAYGGELGLMLEEIRHTMANLRQWAKPKRVPTPLALFPSRSKILTEPLGVVLIIGPWNYPFQLLLTPLIGAIAAGNCAVLKPSELAPRASAVTREMIAKTFPAEYVCVVEGDRTTGGALLDEKWDYIFFTGGAGVGKVVAAAAARHLTPVTLELGGKSPCIVAPDATLDVSARKIAWAKFYNAGQSCVSPDYLLAHKSIHRPLVDRIIASTREFFGPDASQAIDFSRIVNEAHFDRLLKMLDSGRIALGGKHDRSQLYIEPTILEDVGMEDAAMSDEIFGPILPVLEYDTIDQAIHIIEQHPAPLSLYLFTRSKQLEDDVFSRISFGGGCVNDLMIHLANPYLPFGGIGTSGVGSYHGKYTFDTFSHKKSIVSSPFFPDIKIRYQPYRDKLRLLRKLMK